MGSEGTKILKYTLNPEAFLPLDDNFPFAEPLEIISKREKYQVIFVGHPEISLHCLS